MTGHDFVRTCARLSGLSRREATEAADRAMDRVGMTEHMNRAIRGYSKGMRQRTKLAQALVHEPRVLFLDEPLTGTDPVARRDLIDVIRGLGGRRVQRAGVQPRPARDPVADAADRAAAPRPARRRGARPRDPRPDRQAPAPHRAGLRQVPRPGGASWPACDDVDGIKFLDRESGLLVETRQPDAFYARLPALALSDGLALREVYSDDDNLEAVFKYLVNK